MPIKSQPKRKWKPFNLCKISG